MDKLKPVLEQKFWILLGIAIILPIVAWRSMSNQLSADIVTRTSQVDKAFTSVPKDAAKSPNISWGDGLKKINDEREAYIAQESKRLLEAQLKYFRLPPAVEKYRGPFRGKFTAMEGRDRYRVNYENEILALQRIVDPLDPVTGKGKVYLPNGVIPRVPPGRWSGYNLPGDNEIWDAQEDIWLMTSLFEAIKDVNEGKQSIVDAPIKQILSLVLRGGSRADINRRMRESAPAAAKPAEKKKTKSSRRGGFGDDDANSQLVQEMMDEEQGAATSNQIANARPGSISFDLMEVFGDNGEGAAKTKAEKDKEEGRRNFASAMVSAATPGAAPKTAAISRYVDNAAPGQNYVTRGFFIYLVMDHREVPELLAKLASAPFPAEILRVHITGYTFDGRVPSFEEQRATSMGAASRLPQGGDPVKKVDPAADAFARGMRDPALANVAIAGLLTIYQPDSKAANEVAAKAPAANGPNAAAAAPASGAAAPAKSDVKTPAEKQAAEAKAASPATPPAKDAEKAPATPPVNSPPPGDEKNQGTPPAKSPEPAPGTPAAKS